MSVPKPRRDPTSKLLKVQDVAYQLYSYTLHAASNASIVPIRQRWATSKYLLDAASAICKYIDMANSLRTDIPKQKQQRAIHQCTAFGHCTNLITEIYKAFYAHEFSDDKLVYWLDLVDQTMDLIKSWARSEDVVI